MAKTEINRFFLYGEPPRPAGESFVHLEFLDDRSRPANWTIRPHAHADLHQVFFLRAGGGTGEADERRIPIQAPCVVIVPAGVVHAFKWRSNSVGRVLTFSAARLANICAREASALAPFESGMWTASVDARAWNDMLDALARELAWMAPGHELAVEAHLSKALVEVVRLRHALRAMEAAPVGPRALLVAKFRQRVEQDFRNQPTIEALARALGVSVSTLRAACQSAAGVSPNQILHERLVLEARRLMRYSNMSIGQVATYLGFADAAYFSRFFSKQTGISPRGFKSLR